MAVDLYSTGTDMLDPLVSLWNRFVELIPGLIGAIIVAIVGYFIASLVGYVVHKLLEKVQFDKLLKQYELETAVGHTEISGLLGALAKWYIFVIFLGDAARIASLGVLSERLVEFAIWFPNLIVAILIIFFGLMLAHWLEVKLKHEKSKYMMWTTSIMKVLIIFFTAVIALRQAGLDVTLAEDTFKIIVGAIAIAIAVAVGISYGYALKETARGHVKKIEKHF